MQFSYRILNNCQTRINYVGLRCTVAYDSREINKWFRLNPKYCYWDGHKNPIFLNDEMIRNSNKPQ